MTASKIEWCDRSDWNPVRGCTRVSEGCRNCYAEAMAGRFSDPGQWGHGFAKRHANGGRWTGLVDLLPERLTLPLGWTKPARIFVNSTSDVFHESLPDEAIDRVFAVMALAQQHTFVVVTKRAARMRAYLTRKDRDEAIGHRAFDLMEEVGITTPAGSAVAAGLVHGSGGHVLRANAHLRPHAQAWPLPNVWLLVSVEDQVAANLRVPDLLLTPAVVRGVSAEPLIGAVDLTRIPHPIETGKSFWFVNALTGEHIACAPGEPLPGRVVGTGGPCLGWVITGGESGQKARPSHPDWFRSLRDQCAAVGVPFLFKQWGEWASAKGLPGHIPVGHVFGDGYQMVRVGKKAAGRLLDGRTWDQVPEVSHG